MKRKKRSWNAGVVSLRTFAFSRSPGIVGACRTSASGRQGPAPDEPYRPVAVDRGTPKNLCRLLGFPLSLTNLTRRVRGAVVAGLVVGIQLASPA
jgi:hypothetical protein